MYNDYRDRNREGWKFSYKGSELVVAAKKKVEYYDLREKSLRKTLSQRLSDSDRALNSKKNEDLKTQASTAASQREQCEVYVHEFSRLPDREFSLSLSDVVFFGLAGHKPSEDSEE